MWSQKWLFGYWNGCPTGSILGPLIFSTFINDIFFIDTDVTVYHHADNNCISYAHNDIGIIKNILEFDVKKCWIGLRVTRWQAILQNFRVCSSKEKNVNAEDFNIIVDKDALNLTDSMIVLGVNIDDKWNFNSHVSNMCNKTGRQLNILQGLKGSSDYASRLSIYKSFVMSNFYYCPLCGCLHLNLHCQSSRILKKTSASICAPWLVYTSDYLESLNKADVPGVKIMAFRYLAVEVYKCVNGLNPKNIWMTYSLSRSANTTFVTTLL